MPIIDPLLTDIALVTNLSAEVRMQLADGFDFPVGKPDTEGYYKAH